MALVGAIMLMAVNGAIGQQQGAGPADYGGGYAVPGAPGISLGPGTNTVAMSVSIASQQDSQIYFQVNSFAIMGSQEQAFTVYDLSRAMPGIMDTSSNRVQIDIDRLQPSIQSTSQASMDDLYSILRPSVNSLMVVADISQQGQQGARATFQVERLTVIMPDGQAKEFDMSQPMSIVVDGTAHRVFAVGFDQMYSLVDTYITNIQNNYYTEINYNIVTSPVIVVTPPAFYPVLTPIRFPASWPVYYPVPVPVPIPVVSVKPRPPSIRPSLMPTRGPTTEPTGVPVISPTTRPTRRPSGGPAISATARPSGRPSLRPSLVATRTPGISRGPTSVIRPSLRPTITSRPTLGGVPTAFRPSLRPVTTFRPTPGRGGAMPTASRPTIRQTVPNRPTTGGGDRMPIATNRPATGRVSPRGR